MVRVLFLVAFVALVGQATFLLSPSRPVCEESCPDDDANGECTPTCTCTGCCAHHAPVVVLYLTVERLPVGRSLPSAPSTLLPPSAESHEIFHIPKSLFASV